MLREILKSFSRDIFIPTKPSPERKIFLSADGSSGSVFLYSWCSPSSQNPGIRQVLMDTRTVLGVPGLFLGNVEGKAVHGRLEPREQHLERDA